MKNSVRSHKNCFSLIEIMASENKHHQNIGSVEEEDSDVVKQNNTCNSSKHTDTDNNKKRDDNEDKESNREVERPCTNCETETEPAENESRNKRQKTCVNSYV